MQLILEQSMTQFHVMNYDTRQKALDVQVELMLTARSEKVRSDAANSVLTHTKPPESVQVSLDVTDTNASQSIDELRKATLELVRAQKEQIESKTITATQAAHSKIFTPEVEIEEGDFDE